MPSQHTKAPFNHQSVGATEEEWRDGAIPLGGERTSPSAAVAGGQRKRSESRRRHRSRNPRREWTSSGQSDAGSARNPAEKSGIFARVACTGVVDMELADCAVQVLGMGRSGRSSWFTSARLRNLEGAKKRERLFIVGSGQLLPGGAGR